MVSITSLGIWAIGEWILENWVTVGLLTTLLILLGLSGNLSRMFKSAASGLKESITPTGFIILIVLIYVAYQIYLSIMETI
jgi:hypothetical protein